MFENLSQNLDNAIKTLKGQGRISEVNVAKTVKEIRRALVDSDVNYKVAKRVTDKILKDALGQEILISVKPGELFTKVVSDELTGLMGGTAAKVNLTGNPAVVLMSGLQGSGKTTFSGKLALMLGKQNKKTMLIACDVYRPAAINQLKVVSEQTNAGFYSEPDNKNPVEIAKNGIAKAKAEGYKVAVVDTAGRLAVDTEMMDEISRIHKAINPNETLFVVDAMTGQDAVNTAKAFNETIDFDGVVLTKLDGDTRGGAALSIKAEVDKPIKYIGTGEKMDAIDVFHPDRMAKRILGMGDVVSLVERAQQAYDEEEARKLDAKIRKNKFDLEDFLSQIQQIKKMGSLKDLVGMIPGVGKMMKDAEIDDNAFVPIEAIIRSMTPEERSNPEILNGGRKRRIANGSGTDIQQVNNLLKQFNDLRKVMKKMNQGGKFKMPPMGAAGKGL